MIPAVVLTWVVLLAICWLGWQLLQQNGRILLRLEELEKRLDDLEFGGAEKPPGLPAGSVVPDFELPDLAGEPRSLSEFRGQPILLILFNPACGFCRDLLLKLKERTGSIKQRAETESVAQPHVLIISTGGTEANRALFEAHPPGCTALLQRETEVAAACKAHGTPSGYLLDPAGRTASELAMGAEALLALLDAKTEIGKQKTETGPPLGDRSGRESRFNNRSLARSKIKRDGLKAGTPAPDFRLPRLDGRGELALAELRGRHVLLVFSSPHCGPCLTLAPQLEKFHRDHPEIEVVMISKGEPKENRARANEHGLTFPIVLQQQWEVSHRYATFATPIAYLIDEAGVIVQDVVVGTEAILALLAEVDRPADQLEVALR